MAGIDWFRWHHGSVTDPKFQLVAKKTGCSVAEVVAIWAFVLESASQSTDRGNPGELDFESIDCLFGIEDGKALLIYSSMKDRGLFDEDGCVSSWDNRQPKRERDDDSSGRVAAFRKRQSEQEEVIENKDKPCNANESHIEDGNDKESHVTPSNATSRQETPREEKRREDKNKNKTAREARFDFLGALIAKGVPDSVASDYIATRKAKHCVQTETAFGQLVSQSDKAGMLLAETVLLCCRKGWGSFDASWLKPGDRESVASAQSPDELITLPDGRQITKAHQDFLRRMSA